MKKIYILLFMTLCTLGISAAGEVAPTYMFPEGTFFSGYSNKGSLLAPYLYMPAAENYVFTTANAGAWQAGAITATDVNSFDAKYVFGYSSNPIPTVTIGETPYQYGSGSSTEGSKVARVASSSFNLMTSAMAFAAGASATLVAKIADVTDYYVFMPNKEGQVMRVKGVSIPITTNNQGTDKTSAALFPDESAHMCVQLFNASFTRNADWTSTKAKGSKELTPKYTATIANFTPNSDTKQYVGSINIEFEETVDIVGPFVVVLSDFESMGAETRLCVDKAQSNTTLYHKGGKFYQTVGGYFVSVDAMFPCVMKADDNESLNFEAEGGEQQLSIFSNVDPAELTITKPDWVNFTIGYESGNAFATDKKSYINLTIEENEDAAREGTIVIDNHGMKVIYPISQLGKVIVPVEEITLNVSEYILEKGYKTTLKATITPDNATDKSVIWSSSDETVVTVDNGENGTAAGTIHYKKDGVATITATTSNGLTATCVVTAFSYSDFAPFGAATGTWDLIAKSKKLTNLPVMVGQIGANKKRIKVSNFNYSTSDVAKDVIIEWNSETNVCSIAKMSTGYASNKKTIYMETSEDGSYNSLTGVFTLPMKYYTEDGTISNETETLAMNHVANMTIGDAKWGTFFAPFDVTLPEGAFTYTVTVEDNKTVRNKVAEGDDAENNVVPANTAVLVYSSTAINEDYEGYATDVMPVGDNALVGTLEPIASGDAPAGAYYLAKKNDVLNFYPAGQAKLAANRAYLVVPEGAKIEGLFEGEVTGINEVNAKNADSILRNIQGMPVNKGYKGIVIMDGKKYLKK